MGPEPGKKGPKSALGLPVVYGYGRHRRGFKSSRKNCDDDDWSD